MARRGRDIVGPGSIARWSSVAQAYAITPFNLSWSEEILRAAPVLRVMLKSSSDAAENVARRAHKNLVAKRSLTAAEPYLHHLKLYVAYPGGYVTHPGLPDRGR